MSDTDRRSAGSPTFDPPTKKPNQRKRLFALNGDDDDEDRLDDGRRSKRKVETIDEDLLDDYSPAVAETKPLEPPTNKNRPLTDEQRKLKSRKFRLAGNQTSTPLTGMQERLLRDTYYGTVTKPAFPVGRDALWYKVRNKPNCPSWRQVADWIARQSVQQRFAGARKTGGMTNAFIPARECWRHIAIDLISYVFKPAGGFGYVFSCIDSGLSRFMITRLLKTKEAPEVAKALESVLKEIKSKHKGGPVACTLDRGGEFLGPCIDVFEKYGIERRLTLPSAPMQNAIAERNGGALKLVCARQMACRPGSTWAQMMPTATDAKNQMYSRILKASPADALKWNKEQRDAFRKRLVEKGQIQSVGYERAVPLEVGAKVRIKLAKGPLSKMSTPSWSEKIFTIRKVIKHRLQQIADAYLVDGKDDTFRYSRTDLLPITAEVEYPPEQPEKRKTRRAADQEFLEEGSFTRSKLKEVAERQERRQTRLQAREQAYLAEGGAIPPPPPPLPPTKPKQMWVIGDKVYVQYPDKKYPGSISKVSDTSIRVIFKSDNSFTTLKKSQWNLISKRR